MKNGVGELRRSKLVTTFGPGAILDLRTGSGAPLSGVLAGLEEWDRVAERGFNGLNHRQVVNEPRLQKRLDVSGFRLPPVKPELEKRFGSANETSTDVLPVVRFPEWLVCPRCNRLGQAGSWSKEPGRPDRWCQSEAHDGDRVDVFPVRFIVACEDGHLDEFPWTLWAGCRCERPKLFLDTKGPGLAGKVVRCEACKHQRSLEGCFGKEALKTVGITRCRGRQPWLGRHVEEAHDKMPRVLQRGASNVYYSVLRSALDIPPFSSDLAHVFGRYWSDIKDAAPAEWPDFIKLLKLVEKTGKPATVLLQLLLEWKAALDADDRDQPLEWAEYVQFRESGARPVGQKEFQTAPGGVPAELEEQLASVVLASRLREVRVIEGFTRINPPAASSATTPNRGHIYLKRPDWLPAVELRGEGIFLRFDEERVARWAEGEVIQERVERLRAPLARLLGAEEVSASLTARATMLHSLAHALIRRLSLDCGYSSSALRERLYVGEAPRSMCGILIHTGAPDAEGTLGGLVRQGTTDRLWETFRGALHEMSWCSSDPVCITGTVTLSSPENLAACHACLLMPETSCQWYNQVLDRALLIGLPDNPEAGFFHHVLRQSVL
jgi:hypothetical protein